MTIDEEFLVKAAQKRRRTNLLFLFLIVIMIAGSVMFATGFLYEYRALSHGIAIAGLIIFGVIYVTVMRGSKKER